MKCLVPDTGITIRSGTSNQGNIFFSDGTSGDAEYRGIIQYTHGSGTGEHLRLFVNQITDIDSKHKMILNQIDIEISIYLNIKSNKSIALHKLTDVTNRVEQVLYENKRDGSNYFDGQLADIEFNIKNDEEELVDNMMLSRINYNVKIPLAYKLFGFFLDSDSKNFITANNKKFVISN